ncbi:MAG: hypothetical protein MI975_22200 [Cytophagales bacterium]|nr:hypothetical protein [Cytophagales bacterium]
MLTRLIIIIISISQVTTSFSQSWEANHHILEKRQNSILGSYSNSNVAQIISGKRYDLIYRNNVNERFFRNLSPMQGAIEYDGVSIDHIEIQYDLVNQQIVVLLESEDNEEYVIVDIGMVSSLSIGDYRFINVNSDAIMEDGLYQLAYCGQKSNLFIKRQKHRKIYFSGKEAKVKFVPESHFYIKNEYGTFRIASKKDLLVAYKNSEKIRDILKTKKTNFNKKKIENDLVLAIDSYEESNSFDRIDD